MFEKRNIFYPAIAAGLIVFLIFRLIDHEPKKDVMMVNGVAISRTPCLSEINALFEGRVDSNKACDCILPAYYEMLKNDTTQLNQSNEVDMSALSTAVKDSLYTLFMHCVSPYVLDTTYKMHLTGSTLVSFKEQLARKLSAKTSLNGTNIDSVVTCIVAHLNGKFTIPEFIRTAELNDSTIQRLSAPCFPPDR